MMKAQIVFLAGLASLPNYQAQNITCPVLDCTAETGGMTPGVCFESDSRLPTRKFRGGSCSQTFSGVTDLTSFCPFSYMEN
jgi:hypothetical protein